MKSENLPISVDSFKLFNQLNFPVLLLDKDNHPQWANGKFLSIHDLSLDSLKDFDSTKITNAMKKRLYILDRKGCQYSFFLEKSSICTDNKVFLISFFDITRLTQLSSVVLDKKKMFEQLSERLPEGIVLFGRTILYSNPTFEKLIGYSGKDLSTRSLESLMESSETDIFNDNIQRLHTHRRSQVEFELSLLGKKRQKHLVRMKTSLFFQGNEISYLSIITNITRERLEMERLSKLAYYDPLTGIYNRRKFNELFLLFTRVSTCEALW